MSHPSIFEQLLAEKERLDAQGAPLEGRVLKIPRELIEGVMSFMDKEHRDRGMFLGMKVEYVPPFTVEVVPQAPVTKLFSCPRCGGISFKLQAVGTRMLVCLYCRTIVGHPGVGVATVNIEPET